MKVKFLLAAACTAALTIAAQAQTEVNFTGATAFRAATINSIVNAFGGLGSVGIVHSNSNNTNFTGANAISFRGNWPVIGDTIIRCRFSGSTEGIRDLVGTTVPGTPNDVFYYPDGSIPAVGTITSLNENGNPVGANVARKPDLAFSDVQQNSSPFRTPVLSPADSRVGVVTFVFLKSQGSSANLTNVTNQAWRALLANNRGVPLNVFTNLSADQPGRVLATGRNDGSGTRAVYMIEPGVGVSRLVNQFKIGVNGFNGVTFVGNTADDIDALQLWPSSDQQDANNNSILWNPLTTGNGGYFSGSNVIGLLTKDTASVRVLGPTGTDLTSSGSYVGTSLGNPRAVSVVACVGTGDAVGAIAANDPVSGSGGAGLLSYDGVTITPVPTGVDPTGLVPADRYKVTNGSYTLWSYERLFHRGTLTANQNTVYTGIVAAVPGALANSGIALSAMVAVRGNDGDTVTQP
jgi:hypothetical protein